MAEEIMTDKAKLRGVSDRAELMEEQEEVGESLI